jgi:hypothetical protein
LDGNKSGSQVTEALKQSHIFFKPLVELTGLSSLVPDDIPLQREHRRK